MATIRCFEDLKIWQMSRELCKDICQITNDGPFAKDYRFREQLRASSGSIMDNVAEGFERGGNKEFIRFLFIAKGSCGESRSQLYRALDAHHLLNDELEVLKEKAMQISQTIANFINYLKQTETKGRKYKN